MNDYEKFVLTEKEQTIFNKFKKNNTAELSGPEYNLMIWKRLVDDAQIPNSIDKLFTVRLSRVGQELRTYQKMHKKKIMSDNIRYGVTTVIAVVALVLSLLSLHK